MTKITGGVKINTYKNSVFLRRAEDVCSRRQSRISDARRRSSKTIEKRERDGQSVDYLILAMLLGEMKVMVPVDSVERVGLRHVIENDDIDAD